MHILINLYSEENKMAQSTPVTETYPDVPIIIFLLSLILVECKLSSFFFDLVTHNQHRRTPVKSLTNVTTVC